MPPETAPERTLHLASWEDRFVAWLIDGLLAGAVLSAVGVAGSSRSSSELKCLSGSAP